MYAELLTLAVSAADKTPEAEDVVAGWPALILFLLLILAVVVLAFSLVKRLRNVERANEQGLYDPSSKSTPPPDDSGPDS